MRDKKGNRRNGRVTKANDCSTNDCSIIMAYLPPITGICNMNSSKNTNEDENIC